MRDNTITALQTIITDGWGNRTHETSTGAVVSLVDTTTERDMLAEVLAELDYDGAPTMDDVPAAWWVVVEFDDGFAYGHRYPTESAAMRTFRELSGYDGR